MKTLKSEDWGMIARWGYKLVRPALVKIVKDTSNTYDDKLIVVLDNALGFSVY